MMLRFPSIDEMQDFTSWLKSHPEIQLGFGVLGAGLMVHFGREMWFTHKMTVIREAKARKRKEDIDRWGKTNKQLSTTLEKEIISLSLTDLIESLQTGKYSATEVLQAYQHAAYVAHEKTNCLVEPIWEAQAMAENLDRLDGNKGPLHGVPISVKDNYHVKGYDCSLGCTNFCNQPLEEDAPVIKVLKKLGAVPFVKTTVPHTMFSLDTSSPMWGQTTSPYDASRTCGGSSGGEGALLALQGSPLGLGGDIGGSIRVPCHFNGVYGIKPSSYRTSKRGVRGVWKGQNIVRSGYGPMARDVEALAVGMRLAYLHPDIYDSDTSISPLPWQQQEYESSRRLRIGYYEQNGLLECTPACARAVTEAKNALAKQGHELVALDVRDISLKAHTYYLLVMCADRGETFADILHGDRVGPAMKETMALLRSSKYFKRFMALMYRPFEPVLSKFLPLMEGFDSVLEWWGVVDDIEELRTEVSDSWKQKGIDAVIAPGFACPAMLCGTPPKAGNTFSYVNLYNVLDFPVGSVPVSHVTEEDQNAMVNYPTPDPFHKLIKKSSSSGTVGLPLCVQVAALPWKEELCLRVMKELDLAIKNI